MVENLRLTIQNNRDMTMQEMRSFSDVKVTIKPQGTFYCLAGFSSLRAKIRSKWPNLYCEKAMVVTVPGVEFGMEGYLRLSYAGSDQRCDRRH
jgi:aspartate aminotransferase